MKVFCSNCIHMEMDVDETSVGFKCKAFAEEAHDFFNHWQKLGDCAFINANNDCPEFKRKKYPEEELLERLEGSGGL